MFPLNTWCFDLEIANPIPDRNKPLLPGYRYCMHWGDHSGMGIACIAACRPDGSDVRTFTNDPDLIRPAGVLHIMDFLALLRDAELVIGYGSRGFDGKVLAARGVYIPRMKHLDLLFEVKKALRNQAPKGYKLNDISKRCGGPEKSGSGADAPFLWQQGKKEEVIAYCKNDVLMLAAVASHYAITGGYVPSFPPSVPLLLRTPAQIKAQDYAD